MKKVLIATGGSGGHIYPAMVTAQELKRQGCRVLFIGTFGSGAERLKISKFRIIEVKTKGFVSKSFFQSLSAFFYLVKALFRCGGVIVSFRPQVVLGFGGYSSVPTLLMAWVFGIPVVLHEQNVVPGEANKLLARFSRRICVGFRDSLAYFPVKKTVWTGTPFRPFKVLLTREEACEKFHLDPRRKTFLVFGGSQGSRRLNECFFEVLKTVPHETPWQVIHLTGAADFAHFEKAYSTIHWLHYVKDYISNIEDAYAAADLVIARSGAGTVNELGILGKPAILIPYPGAKNHQIANASILTRVNMALIIEEKDLSSEILKDKIFNILNKNTSSDSLREPLRKEFVFNPAQRLADEVMRLIGSPSVSCAKRI